MSELVSGGEEHAFQEKQIAVGEKTLVLPPSVRNKIRELDGMILDQDYASEVAGFGLTREDGNRIKVVDLVLPDPQKVFKIDMIFRGVDHDILTELLEGAERLTFTVVGNGAILRSTLEGGSNKWILFTQKGSEGKIDWTWASREVQKLVGFELPDSVDELENKVKKRKDEMGQDDDGFSLELPAQYDMIVSPTRTVIADRFMERVRKQAGDADAKIGFSTHHHPSLALLAFALQGKPLANRESAYNELLSYSANDVRMNLMLGIDVFEIRAFGNPSHPFVPSAGTTSRFYSVKNILETDMVTREKVLGPQVSQ